MTKPLNRTLFHGTGHYFREGEVLEPSEKNFFSENLNIPGARSFATSRLMDAKEYAGRKAAKMGMLFAPVYEVEAENPVSMTKEIDEQPIPEHMKMMLGSEHAGSYSSTKPMVPKNIVAWGINTDFGVSQRARKKK